MIADDIWDMMLGKSGKLPGALAPELVAKAKEQGREFHEEDPQSNYPDALDEFRKEMADNGWDLGEDEEELFELAMHPQQYRAYKSGKAKADFEADLAKRKAEKNKGAALTGTQTVVVDVDGQKYQVTFGPKDGSAPVSGAAQAAQAAPGEGDPLASPLEGKFYLVKNSGDVAVKVGDVVKKGQTVCYIEAMKTFNAIAAEKDGVVTEISVVSGSSVAEDDVLMKIK